MTCASCDPTLRRPGKIIKTDGYNICSDCGEFVYPNVLERDEMLQQRTINESWDKYFQIVCKAVAEKSPCLSRKIGALLVKDHSIISTGYNGPPRGIPHCGHDRYMKDNLLSHYNEVDIITEHTDYKRFRNECPRKVMDFKSGEGMQWCPAQHAEENAVSNAARIGVSVLGSTLCMNSIIPCQKCFGTLINAGIVEIVVDEVKVYDKHTLFLISNSNITIRRFKCGL